MSEDTVDETGRPYAEVIEDLRLHQTELEQQVDELHRADERIRVLGERFHGLFEVAPTPLVATDRLGVIRSANRAAHRLLDTQIPLAGRPLVTSVEGADHLRLRQALAHRGADHRAELTLRDAHGRSVPCTAQVAILAGGPDDEDEVLFAFTDRREEERVLTALAEAERATAIRQLTAGMAHDFNNLLTVIGNSLTLLRSGAERDASTRLDWFDAAQEATERGARFVAQLLSYARAESIEPTPTDIATTLRHALPLIRNAVGETVTVRLELDDGLPVVETDPVQLEAALLNLCINAANAASPQIELRGWRDADGDAVIEVADHGNGMSPTVLARSTDAFFTTGPQERSSGLGLTMVASVARRSGGRLELESTPEVGTVARLVLPASGEPAVDVDPPRTQDGGRLDGVRLLLVEDQEPLRRTMRAVLEQRGAQVVDVPDAQSALEALATQPVDLVLSDVLLGPGRSGIDLAHQLADAHRHLPVLLMSGHHDLAATDGWTLLRKPVRADRLAAAIRTALRASADEQARDAAEQA